MGFKYNKSCVKILLMKNKIITDEINKKIEKNIIPFFSIE